MLNSNKRLDHSLIFSNHLLLHHNCRGVRYFLGHAYGVSNL